MIDFIIIRGITHTKPLPVVEYNAYMSGVDRNDPMLAYCPCDWKTVRWYNKLFFHYLQVIVINSFILYKVHCCTISVWLSSESFYYTTQNRKDFLWFQQKVLNICRLSVKPVQMENLQEKIQDVYVNVNQKRHYLWMPRLLWTPGLC